MRCQIIQLVLVPLNTLAEEKSTSIFKLITKVARGELDRDQICIFEPIDLEKTSKVTSVAGAGAVLLCGGQSSLRKNNFIFILKEPTIETLFYFIPLIAAIHKYVLVD